MSELATSLRLSWHVVVRNWIVYRKDFLANISPTLADPALMMASLGMGLSPFITDIYGLSYAQFLAPGLIATTALFTAFFECSYGFYVRMTFESVFKAMLTTPIGVREVVIGEFLWVFIRAALMALGVGLVLAVMGLLPNPLGLLVFPIIGGTLAVPCGAIGLLAAAKVRNINQFQTVYSFLIAPIYFLSGVFFPALRSADPWDDRANLAVLSRSQAPADNGVEVGHVGPDPLPHRGADPFRNHPWLACAPEHSPKAD